jgi:hypothetical protein
MTDIDDKIREALNADDQKVLDQFGSDPGPISMMLDTFRGKQWWFTVAIWIFGFSFFVLMIVFGQKYFAAEDLKTSLTWGIAFLLCGMGMVIVKVGAWQLMQTQMLLREIKRLELRWLQSERE